MRDRLAIMMACLLHDTGKVTTTKTILKEGLQRIVSPGHAQVSSRLSEVFLDQIGAPLWLTQRPAARPRTHDALAAAYRTSRTPFVQTP